MQLVYDRPPGISQGKKVEVSNELVVAAKNIIRLTSDWYAFENHYISEELAENLLVLTREINKLNR